MRGKNIDTPRTIVVFYICIGMTNVFERDWQNTINFFQEDTKNEITNSDGLNR